MSIAVKIIKNEAQVAKQPKGRYRPCIVSTYYSCRFCTVKSMIIYSDGNMACWWRVSNGFSTDEWAEIDDIHKDKYLEDMMKKRSNQTSTSRQLKEGDIIDLEPGHQVYADVQECLVYSNCKASHRIVHDLVTIGGKLANLAGRYVVYKTAYDGGGIAQGMDVYPDGHHVFCERLDDPTIKIDFYQSGCFTAVIPHIKPVGHAVRTWRIT